jgi:acyl carrier protein
MHLNAPPTAETFVPPEAARAVAIEAQSKGTPRMASEPLPTIENHLLGWFNERLRLSIPITAETDLLDSGYLDSLLIMEVLRTIERHYRVQIDNALLVPQHFRSVQTLAALVNGARSALPLTAH